MSALYPVAEGSEAKELESDEENETVPPTDERDGEVKSDKVLDGDITREELSESQRNDDALKHIRDKTYKRVLMSMPWKKLIIVPK